MDFLTPEQRSERMKRVRSSNTQPEKIVRKLVSSLGFRYRLNVRALPGAPDLTFRRLKKAIFVHGCFWHGHESCKRATLPKTRAEFWAAKQLYNKRRDEANLLKLRELGWETLVIWECGMKDQIVLTDQLRDFLRA